MTGFAFNISNWSVGWTKGYSAWERIYWIGPVGLMFRAKS